MKTYTTASDIRRALSSRGFIISLLGTTLVIFLSSLESIISVAQSADLLQNGYHAQFIFVALASDTFTLALPILCALPYTAAFVDDIKSGYIKLHLHRSGVKLYIKAKLMACALSGDRCSTDNGPYPLDKL
jgi:ABC-type transport system involved in multi-copper enzyme maturation permease subunit